MDEGAKALARLEKIPLYVQIINGPYKGYQGEFIGVQKKTFRIGDTTETVKQYIIRVFINTGPIDLLLDPRRDIINPKMNNIAFDPENVVMAKKWSEELLESGHRSSSKSSTGSDIEIDQDESLFIRKTEERMQYSYKGKADIPLVDDKLAKDIKDAYNILGLFGDSEGIDTNVSINMYYSELKAIINKEPFLRYRSNLDFPRIAILAYIFISLNQLGKQINTYQFDFDFKDIKDFSNDNPSLITYILQKNRFIPSRNDTHTLIMDIIKIMTQVMNISIAQKIVRASKVTRRKSSESSEEGLEELTTTATFLKRKKREMVIQKRQKKIITASINPNNRGSQLVKKITRVLDNNFDANSLSRKGFIIEPVKTIILTKINTHINTLDFSNFIKENDIALLKTISTQKGFDTVFPLIGKDPKFNSLIPYRVEFSKRVQENSKNFVKIKKNLLRELQLELGKTVSDKINNEHIKEILILVSRYINLKSDNNTVSEIRQLEEYHEKIFSLVSKLSGAQGDSVISVINKYITEYTARINDLSSIPEQKVPRQSSLSLDYINIKETVVESFIKYLYWEKNEVNTIKGKIATQLSPSESKLLRNAEKVQLDYDYIINNMAYIVGLSKNEYKDLELKLISTPKGSRVYKQLKDTLYVRREFDKYLRKNLINADINSRKVDYLEEMKKYNSMIDEEMYIQSVEGNVGVGKLSSRNLIDIKRVENRLKRTTNTNDRNNFLRSYKENHF